MVFTMTDFLWPDGPRFKDESGVFRLGTDSVILAYFAKNTQTKKKRAADLGCGSGIISIILAWDNPELVVDSIEIQPRAVRLAIENTQLNGLSGRVNIIEGDLRRYTGLFQAGAYDLTISNPPYYTKGSGKVSDAVDSAAARIEEFCSLDDVCKAAGYLTRWGGAFLIVHKPERLAEIFRSLTGAGLEPKRLRFVHHKNSSPPSLVLIESRRGGNPSLKVEAPLILANDDGSDSEESSIIYRR